MLSHETAWYRPNFTHTGMIFFVIISVRTNIHRWLIAVGDRSWKCVILAGGSLFKMFYSKDSTWMSTLCHTTLICKNYLSKVTISLNKAICPRNKCGRSRQVQWHRETVDVVGVVQLNSYIPSISGILSWKWSHFVQCAKRHHTSLI